MWSKGSLFLFIRVRVRWINLWISIALYSCTQFILTFDSLLSILPGEWCAWARKVTDTIYAILNYIMHSEPETFAHVEVADKGKSVFVDVKTGGPLLYNPKGSKDINMPFGAAFLARNAACVLGLCAAAALFDWQYSHMILCGIFLALFYTFARPILAAVTLPLNMLLFGLITPLTDALLVRWALAWVGDYSAYWEAVAAALLIGAFFAPYTYLKCQAARKLVIPQNQ